MIRFTVYGQCYSLKNSKILTTQTGGRPRTIKHAKARQFEQDFLLQVPSEVKQGITLDVSVTLRIYYPSRRQDLDEAIVLDLLQKSGVIANDRQVKEKHVFWGLDPENPRVEVQVETL